MYNLSYQRRGGGEERPNVLTLTATTTAPGQTVTIQKCTPSIQAAIGWGDGTVETIAAAYAGTLTHVYAATGVYSINISAASKITAIDLRDAKLGKLDTVQLRSSPITYFYVTAITGSTIRSADMVAWRPLYWYLYAMPAGTYNIASANMVAWRPTSWQLYAMPAGTYNIASADMVAWRPTDWRLYAMPAGTYTFAAACMQNWTTVRAIRADGLALAQATVDTILNDVYAGKATYTWATPTLNVGGTNAAPSGVYQAMCPPVTGKEFAYELVNDSCNIGGPEWTVTFTP